MVKIRSTFNQLLDFLMVLALSVGTMTLVRFITLDFVSLPGSFSWLAFVVICYVFRFGFSLPNISTILKRPLISLFLLIYAWEVIQQMLLGKSISATYFFRLLSYLVFIFYFYRLTNSFRDFSKLLKPYILYFFYIGLTMLLSAILISFGILSATDNQIGENALMKSNMDSYGQAYYWPGFLSVITSSFRIDIMGLPVFCGLSHEPHVLGNCTIPAFFLSFILTFNHKAYRSISYLLLLVIIILAFSVTTTICLIVVTTFIFTVYNIHKKEYLQSILFGFIFMIVILITASQTEILEQIIFFISEKISGSESVSMDYSGNLLSYAFKPTTLIGDGLYPLQVYTGISDSSNIGLVSFFLIIIFACRFYYETIKYSFSKNITKHYIGLSCMYFSLHSLKLGPLILNYPIVLYLVILLTFVSDNNHNEYSLNIDNA